MGNIKAWLKSYFRALIKASPANMKVGDKMIFGMRFRDRDGNWGPIVGKTEVNKDEL